MGNLYSACFFLCCVFLLSPFTGTTTTQSVTVVCSRASPNTVTVTMAPTSVGLAASGQHDVVLPSQVI